MVGGDLGEFSGALVVQLEIHHRLAGARLKAEPGVLQVAAVQQRQGFKRVNVVALAGRQPAGRGARFGEQVEAEFGGASQQRLDTLRVGDAGQLHDDTVIPLAHDQRLHHAGFVQAAAHYLQAARHRVVADFGFFPAAFAARQIIGVHFQQQVRAALQVQPQGQAVRLIGRRQGAQPGRRQQAGQGGAQAQHDHQAVGYGPDPESVHSGCL